MVWTPGAKDLESGKRNLFVVGVVSKIVVTNLKKTLWVFFCSLALVLQSLPSVAIACPSQQTDKGSSGPCHCCLHNSGKQTCCGQKSPGKSKTGKQKGSHNQAGCELSCGSSGNLASAAITTLRFSQQIAAPPPAERGDNFEGILVESAVIGSDSSPPFSRPIAPDLGRAPPVL